MDHTFDGQGNKFNNYIVNTNLQFYIKYFEDQINESDLSDYTVMFKSILGEYKNNMAKTPD